MTALTISNFPDHLLTRLRDRADKTGRTVEEQLISAADLWLQTPPETQAAAEELHLIPSPEIPAPFDLELEGVL